MRITAQFHFNDSDSPAAVSGVFGPVTDLILPCVGDIVRHRDDHGIVFMGKVTDKLFSYDITDGANVDGDVTVTVSMDRMPIQ